MSTLSLHIKTARQTLGARNTAHAIARALETNQIPSQNLSRGQLSELERDIECLGIDIIALGMMADEQEGEDYFETMQEIVKSLKRQQTISRN